MPSAPGRPCRRAGCAELVFDRKGYCDVHQKEVWKEKARNDTETNPEIKRFYDSTVWQRTRTAVLRHEPWCRECRRQGRMKLAEMVDHIHPIKLGGAKLDTNNLQPMCDRCHNAKRANEQRVHKQGSV